MKITTNINNDIIIFIFDGSENFINDHTYICFTDRILLKVNEIANNEMLKINLKFCKLFHNNGGVD